MAVKSRVSVWKKDDDEEEKKVKYYEGSRVAIWEQEEEEDEELLLLPKEQPTQEEQREEEEEKKPGFFERATDWVKDVFTSDKPKEGRDYTVRYDPREEGRAPRSLDEVVNYTPKTKDSTKRSAQVEISVINSKMSELDVKRQEVSKFLTRKVKPIELRTPEEREEEKRKWAEMEALKAEYIGSEKVAKVTTMEDFLVRYLDEDYRTLKKSKEQLEMVVKNTETGKSNKAGDLLQELAVTLERENLPIGIGGLFGLSENLKKKSVSKKLSKGEELTESEKVTEMQIKAESEFEQRDTTTFQKAAGGVVPMVSLMTDVYVSRIISGVSQAITWKQKLVNAIKVSNTRLVTTDLTKVGEYFAGAMEDQYTTVTTEDGGFELVRTKEGDIPLTAASGAVANIWGNSVIELLGGEVTESILGVVFKPLAKVMGKSVKLKSLGNTKVVETLKKLYVSKTLKDMFARNSPVGELAEEYMANQYDKFTAGEPLGMSKKEAEDIAGTTLLLWGLFAPIGYISDFASSSITQKDLEKLSPVVREELTNVVETTDSITEEELKQTAQNIKKKIEAGEIKPEDVLPGAKVGGELPEGVTKKGIQKVRDDIAKKRKGNKKEVIEHEVKFDSDVYMWDKKELVKKGFGVEAMGFNESADVYFIGGKPAVAMSWIDEGLAGFSVAKDFRRQGIATGVMRDILNDNKGKFTVVDPNSHMLAVLNKVGDVSEPDGAGVVTVTERKQQLKVKETPVKAIEGIIDGNVEKKFTVKTGNGEEIVFDKTVKSQVYNGKIEYFQTLNGETLKGEKVTIRYLTDSGGESLKILNFASGAKGMGYGTDILKKIIKEAKDTGVKKIIADDVNYHNASGYWQKQGFKDTGNGNMELVLSQPKTQKQKVKETLKEGEAKTIKQIAKETKILEPNIRRILGVGTKEGEFERVADGVYTLTKDGKSLAYIIPGDALIKLPKLAKKGFKADMVFLDIPYKTPAITGGNRGMKYDFITPEEFGDVLDSVNKILKSKDSAVIYMFSNAKSGVKKMSEYNNMLDKKGLNVIARGQWQKRFKTGEKVTNVRGEVAEPEGILLLSQSGKLSKKYAPIDLNFDLVRPKGYQSEKNADMIAQMIQMTTREGDIVLDPFVGSGVVPAETVKAGRVAVGIEKKKKVVEETILPRVREAAGEYIFENWVNTEESVLEKHKSRWNMEEFYSDMTEKGQRASIYFFDKYLTPRLSKEITSNETRFEEAFRTWFDSGYDEKVIDAYYDIKGNFLKPKEVAEIKDELEYVVDQYVKLGNKISKWGEELEPIIKDEADLSKEIVPKRKKKSAQYSAAMFSPEQQQKINEAIYESPSENIEHSYLSNQISTKKNFEPAVSVEEYKRRIDQMHKFGQLYSVPRRGGLKSPTAGGMYVSVPMDSEKRKETLRRIKLPEVGEIRIKDRYLSPTKFGLEILAHELGHALHYQITGGTGKSIRPIFDDGTMTNEEWQTIVSELEAVEIATQGAEAVAADPTYYGKETEKLAYFLGAYVSNRPLVTKIAPNAISAFVNQSITNQVIADYLDATNEMIDKGAVVSKFIPDRRQRYQGYFGKTVGDKAFMVEQIYKSTTDRAIVGISRLIEEKFKDIKDDPTLLFRAAEGISHTTDGKPAFGTKEYKFPENGRVFKEQEILGLTRLKYKIEVSDVDGSQRAWTWKRTPKVARESYEQLSPKGKKLIREFTADLTEAKDWFNRNKIAQTYGVEETLEGWVHRIYPKVQGSGGIFGWKRLQKKTASALQRRKLSTAEALREGLIEDLQKSMLSGLVELEVKKNFNTMVEQMFGTVVLPVGEGMPVKKGWVEVSGDIYTGIAKKYEKQRKIIIKDGVKIIPPTRNYQMPKDIYDRFSYYTDVSSEGDLFSRSMDLLYKWWRINVLTHPGTVATNFVGGAIQYMSKVVEDFYIDAMFMPGDIKSEQAPFAQTRLNMQALFAALSPKGWQSAPEWLYGGDSSTSFGMVRENKEAIDKANQSLDKAASKMLFTFNAVENYWKKVITYSTIGKGGVDQLNSQDVFQELSKEQEELMKQIYDSVDMYGYDYGNRAKLLEGYSEGSAGKVIAGIKPFATYLYKYEKHLESYITGAFDSSLSPQKRLAKVMTLATMIGFMLAAQAVRDDEKETPEGDESTDPRLRARGRTFVRTDKEGNEMFVRTSKYPFADIADAVKALANKDYQTVVDITQDKFGALSPAVKLALISLGYTNDFEKYTPKEILFADTVASYFPFSRVLSDLAQATDPFKRKQTKWYQSFTSFLPLPGASEETLTALRGEKKTLRIPAEGNVVADIPGRTTKTVDLKNYWQDTILSFFTGIYVTRINPEYAKAMQIRSEKLEQEKEESSEYESSLKEAADMYLNKESSMKGLYLAMVKEKYGKTTNLSETEKRGATKIRKDLKQQILLESNVPHPEFVTASGSNATKADFLADYKEEMGANEFNTYLKTLWKAEVISSDLLDMLVINKTISRSQANSIEGLNRTAFF